MNLKKIILDEIHTQKNTYDSLCDIPNKENRWHQEGGGLRLGVRMEMNYKQTQRDLREMP